MNESSSSDPDTHSQNDLLRAMSTLAVPALLSTKQLAELLGVSYRKLESDRLSGTCIPFLKIGRRVLYRRDDVAKFLEANRFSSTAEFRHGRRQAP